MLIYVRIPSNFLPSTPSHFLPHTFSPAYIQCTSPFTSPRSLFSPSSLLFHSLPHPPSPLPLPPSPSPPLSLSPSLIPETLPGGGHRSLAGGRGGSGTHSADPAQAPTLGPRPACLPLLHSWSCLQVSRRTTRSIKHEKKMKTCTSKIIFKQPVAVHIYMYLYLLCSFLCT